MQNSDYTLTIYKFWQENRWKILVAFILYFILFQRVYIEWAIDCWNLDDFSHCLLIPLVSGYILYSHRKSIASNKQSGGTLGLSLMLVSMAVFFYGFGHSWSIFERIGTVGCLIGLVGYLFGSKLIRIQAFPLFYLILAIPIPFVIYGKISRALRGIVTSLSASILHVIKIPAYNQGNVLVVDEHVLGVVDACSGIRSIMAIISVAILFTYLFKAGIWGGIILTALTLPIAVSMNIIRVLTMAFFLFKFNLDLTEGALHSALGFGIFALIIIFMYAGWLFVKWLLNLEDVPTQEKLFV